MCWDSSGTVKNKMAEQFYSNKKKGGKLRHTTKKIKLIYWEFMIEKMSYLVSQVK